MKDFKFLLLVAFISLCSMPMSVYAGDTSKSPIVLGRTNNGHSQRPKTPDRQTISCYYDGDVLTIWFAFAEGECCVRVSDEKSGTEQLLYFDSTSLFVELEVGEIYNMYIEIITELGNEYSGHIE